MPDRSFNCSRQIASTASSIAELGGAANGSFAGAIDELYLFRRGLTPAEVRALSGAGAIGLQPEPRSGEEHPLQVDWARDGVRFRDSRWQRGRPGFRLLGAEQGFGMLTGISGRMVGTGEWVFLDHHDPAGIQCLAEDRIGIASGNRGFNSNEQRRRPASE